MGEMYWEAATSMASIRSSAKSYEFVDAAQTKESNQQAVIKELHLV